MRRAILAVIFGMAVWRAGVAVSVAQDVPLHNESGVTGQGNVETTEMGSMGGDPRGLYDLGVARAQRGELQQAVEAFTSALEADPNLVDAYVDRGRVLALFEPPGAPNATADFRRALQVDPNLAEVYYRRGVAHASSTQVPAAREDFERAAVLYTVQGDLAGLQRAMIALIPLRDAGQDR